MKQDLAAMSGIDNLILPVTVGLCQHGVRSVFFVDPLELTGNNLGSLIPGDSDVLALSPVLGVPLAVGIPVNPLEGIFNSIGGIGPFFVSQ
jgi:hypothetical protein